MQLHLIHQPELAATTSLLINPESKHVIVIDPVRCIDPLVDYLTAHDLTPVSILETHVHADFISGAPELKQAYREKPKIYCSSLGGKEWTPPYTDVTVEAETSIPFSSVVLKPFYSPGHTPEHVMWLVFDRERSQEMPFLAFTGDCLFAGSVGRPDLLGDEAAKGLTEQLYETLFTKIPTLPEGLLLYPSHGQGSLCGKSISPWQSTNLGYERLFNPFLQKKSKEQWLQDAVQDMPAPPKSFARIKAINAKRQHPSPFQKPPRLNAIPPNAQLVDIRMTDEYGPFHIKESLNIPANPQFLNWSGMILDPNRPIVLVVQGGHQAEPISKLLWMIGLESVVGYIILDEATIKALGLITCSLRTVPPEEAPRAFILDVRTPGEWKQGHIPDAHHIELAKLTEKASQLPKDVPISVICGAGQRGAVAASYLKSLKFAEVCNIAGGMAAWQSKKLPVQQ